MSAPGRPKREHRSAQHEGGPVSALVYLASRSPRRQELLRQLGVRFVDTERRARDREGEAPAGNVPRRQGRHLRA